MPSLVDRIVVDKDVMFGKPRIKGTRVTVETVLRRMSEGATVAELLADYPHICEDDIRAVLAYALALVSFEDTMAAAE
jgi:uncharacterized protein (DUF433 family)